MFGHFSAFAMNCMCSELLEHFARQCIKFWWLLAIRLMIMLLGRVYSVCAEAMLFGFHAFIRKLNLKYTKLVLNLKKMHNLLCMIMYVCDWLYTFLDSSYM